MLQSVFMVDITTQPRIPDDVQEALHLYPYLMQHLLYYRGVVNAADAETFLRPDYERDIHDPFLLNDMDRAVERIEEAMKKGETIAVYHDYDMDGIPGGVVLHDLFTEHEYDNVIFYTPHRNRDGFGLNIAAIDILKERGVTLIVTVDCGIMGINEVAHANKIGVDVIITDHHLPGDTLPAAYAIVNPNKGTCDYPNKNICGAGVAWQLARALGTKREKWMLDMVGAATLSDMVSLTGENRAFVHFGLKVLRKSQRPGLVALYKKTKVSQSYLTEEDLTFMIAPRVNAASRMDNPELAFEALTADNPELAYARADDLEELNNKRKGSVAAMVREAHTRLKDRELNDVIVIGSPDWLPGLAGLVATTLAEEYSRPVFVYGGSSEDVEVLKGSCRSNGVIDLVALMQSVNDQFIGFGGHAFSGGFEIHKDNVHKLESALSDACDNLEDSSELSRVVDLGLMLEQVNWDTYRQIEQLGPFGVGNPKPEFVLRDVTPTAISNFGKEQNHLKITFDHIEAIGFFMTSEQFGLEDGKSITLIVHIEQSFFRGKPELRLRIVDIV